ncbi:hypothetical protein PL321_10705 [Caloramator sp. mosi_1]|uniref:hypothetical protein n=1 Tax=Caloramator sp. mosi_1 TaxID=3023090 RepID=UPI00236022EC|nr:hypothetical protein [Caloramator sp. mosi_1]WDC83256.1 hypothetical protein PL321_10705 [Caloramator sp. mosi_1]
MQIPLPPVMPKFTVFRFIAGIIIKLVGIWGYYLLLIGLSTFMCLKFCLRAYENKSFDTVLLIVIFYLILVGGIVALINS